MKKYSVKALKNKNIRVSVPGSKSITNRALLLAALTEGKSVLNGTLFSDDSRYFLQSLVDLGFKLEIDEVSKQVVVYGCGGKIPNKSGSIYVGSAGTAARFLTAMLGLSDGEYTINASEQMKKRPMQPLFDALKELGSKIEFLEVENALPVRIKGCFNGRVKSDELEDNKISLDISKSTQFLSALLMTGCMCEGGLSIEITSEKKEGSYINITKKMVSEFGGEIRFDGKSYYVSPTPYKAMEYQIEPDVSAACYFYAMAAIYGGSAQVMNVHFDSTQGDIRFLEVLAKMGCEVNDNADGIIVIGPDKTKGEKLVGIAKLDMNNFSDQALTVANVAIFADSPTTICNIAHIRGQECDRLNAIAVNLRNMGIEVDEMEDAITIYPGEIKPADIETFEDHRVAMSFALSGLSGIGINILNPMCCKKTFEEFFDVLDTLC